MRGTQNQKKLNIVKISKHFIQSYNSYEATFKWFLGNEDGKFGGVSCMCVYDVSGDGCGDLLVGREDGHVQLYSYHEMDEPLLRYRHVRMK